MNIDQLAARLARLPRPNGWTDEDALEAWRTFLCAAVDSGLQVLDAATSYPAVRPEDVKRGEAYWCRHTARQSPWYVFQPIHDGIGILTHEIRGPIPRPE